MACPWLVKISRSLPLCAFESIFFHLDGFICLDWWKGFLKYYIYITINGIIKVVHNDAIIWLSIDDAVDTIRVKFAQPVDDKCDLV